MLARYEDAQETLNGPSDIKGDGNSIAAMPSTWNDSYRELERCLLKLRTERPTQYWHLCERYVRCATKQIEVPMQNGKPKLPPHTELAAIRETGRRYTTVMVKQWTPAVRAEKVRKAIDYIASEFKGEPYLPAELRVRVAA